MLKIRMIDSTCFDNWHLQFNSQLIEVLSNIAGVVEYRGVQNIGENRLNINRKKIFVVKSSGRRGIILRFLFTLLNDTWQLVITPKDEILVYSFDSTVTIRLINMINKVLKKRIIMFRHGSMEMLHTNPRGKGFFYRFENKLTRQFFKNEKIKISDNIYFVVLGDVIIKNLSVLLHEEKMKHFLSIDLLSKFDLDTFSINKLKTTKLNIGTIGVLNEYKGASAIIKLAKNLIDTNIKNVSISVTGKIDIDISQLQDVGIDIPSNDGKSMVSPQELKDRLDKLDFILYFYSVDTYKLTASAAVFEAINRKRPIIALKNEYFEYIFNKYGSFGYLVDSVEEMAKLIYLILDGNEKVNEYNFDKIQKMLSTDVLTKKFKDQLCNIGFVDDVVCNMKD